MQLDRQALFELPQETQDAVGDIFNPPPPAVSLTLWVAKDDKTARRRMLSERQTSTNETVFTARFREDLNTKFLVTYAGRKYQILGMMERSRRDYLDIVCSTTR